MRLDQFDYELPEDRIALRPAVPRDAARLLEVRPDGLADRTVADLPDLLRPGDLLVLNDTRVIAAQLAGTRARGDQVARIGVTLIARVGPETFEALARPGRKLDIGDTIRFGAGNDACQLGELAAGVAEKHDDGRIRLVFDRSGGGLDEAIALIGAMPLPPYIAGRRPADERDFADYQTVYAAHEGAVAAPTAGLHMTGDLFAALAARGVGHEFVTLHVSAGTFLPVKADDIAEHRMHAEQGVITEAVAGRINAARRAGGRIVAVGTTALRLLETAVAEDGTVRPFAGATDIFITPGYRFGAVGLLMTNFHLPRSTLFMLVAAFSGLARMKAAYAHAVADGYRFYSYGDACLLHPAGQEAAP